MWQLDKGDENSTCKKPSNDIKLTWCYTEALFYQTPVKFTYTNLKIKTLEKYVKYVQS